MKAFKFILYALSALGFAAMIYTCGGGGGGAKGEVAVYVTDDMSGFEKVALVANSVELVHTGSATTCILLRNEEIDIVDFSSTIDRFFMDTMSLVAVADCPARSYNRLRFEFGREVVLSSGNITNTCQFAAETDFGGRPGGPDRLRCRGDTCAIDINGAVNVFANQTSKLALDFDLKEFRVEGFPGEDCTVTRMKVSPLNASGMQGKKNNGYHEGLSGFITDLPPEENQEFTLAGKDRNFLVDYSGIVQPGIYNALTLAAEKRLEVKVLSSNIDFDSSSVIATAVYVQAEGVVGNLDESARTFELIYGGNKINVDFTNAFESGRLEGTIDNGSYVEVMIYGWRMDGKGFYLAGKVEVENH